MASRFPEIIKTYLKSDCHSPCWSPDGKELAFIHENKVWSVPSNGGSPQEFKNTQVTHQIIWAPGRNILYQRPGNRNFHFLDPTTGAERALVANDSVGWIFYPRYSPDSKNVAVYWNRWEGNRPLRGIWLISLEDSLQRLLSKGYAIRPIEWSADGKWIYAIDYEKKPARIQMISTNGNEAKTLVTLPFETQFWRITITPDGKRIVCSVNEKVSDVWLMENFDPAVK